MIASITMRHISGFRCTTKRFATKAPAITEATVMIGTASFGP